MLKKKNIVIMIIMIILLGAAIGGVLYMIRFKRYDAQVKALSYTKIDISTIPDGSYTGASDVDFISAKVQVTIKNGRIINIDLLEHHNDRGSAAETIVETMIDEQTIDVDTISGATNSSKVIKKAAENALTGK